MILMHKDLLPAEGKPDRMRLSEKFRASQTITPNCLRREKNGNDCSIAASALKHLKPKDKPLDLPTPHQ
jgi:hypothetical protein